MIDLKFIFYLFSRLAPFIIVCFFLLQSMIHQDLKGIIYLAGLILACTITILFGSFPGFQNINTKTKLPDSRYNVCKLIEFSGGPISYLPLGINILSFSFFYLLYNMIKYNLVNKNSLLIFVFIILIVTDFMYNYNNDCAKPWVLSISLIIGGGVGILWSYIVNLLGDPNLQIITGSNPNITCKQPNKINYIVKTDTINKK
jgi:hypothetical protein